MTTPDALPTRRPGGLTALATLNIIFAVIGMLAGLAMSSMNSKTDNLRSADQLDLAAEHMHDQSPAMGGNPELSRAMAHGMAAQMRTASPSAFRWMNATGYLGGLLLLVSGFGFLGQRRYAGRYAALGACVVLTICAGAAVHGMGILYWGAPLLGGGYAITVGLLAQFVYRPALQR